MNAFTLASVHGTAAPGWLGSAWLAELNGHRTVSQRLRHRAPQVWLAARAR